MINQAELDRVYDCDVVDAHGEKIGSIKQVWLDDRTGAPLWAEVGSGLFGMRDSFIPMQDARLGDGEVVVPVEKKVVKDSPHPDISSGHISEAEQEELYRYYGMVPSAATGEHDRMRGDEEGITRYEEQLDVGTRDVEVGRVRLVKHVVTEEQNISVPVSHEEVRVVREPADGREKAGRDAFTDQETEVTLHREEPVVQKTTKPVENVRLEKNTVTEQQNVSDTVRKEHVDIEEDGDVPKNRRDRR
ncbi:DUF2382 domain-containing protein [Actinokineospora sp. 24-640]